MIKHIINKVLYYLFAEKWKEWYELRYWKRKKVTEKKFSNAHYLGFFTDYFDFTFR